MLSPLNHFNRAKQAVATGQYETARIMFKQILEAYPKSAETHFHLGRLELQDGNPKKARQHLMTALRIQPKEPVIWTSLLDVEIALRDKKAVFKLLRKAKSAGLPKATLKQLHNKVATGNKQGVANLVGITEAEFQSARGAFMEGKFPQAVAITDKLLEKAPKNAPLHAIRAAALSQIGAIKEAREAYEKAIEIDPEYFEAHLQLGQLLTAIDELDEAEEQLITALELAKDSPIAQLSYGIVQSKRLNHKKAIELLERARRHLADEPRLHLYLAQSYQGEARADEARAALQRVEKANLTLDEKMILVRTLTETEEMERAGQLLQELRQEHPDMPRIMALETQYNMLAGNIEEVRRSVREQVARGQAAGGQLLAYARSGKMERGDPVADEMVRVFEANQEGDEIRAEIAFALAKMHDDWGEYKKSFPYLKAGNDAMKAKAMPRKSKAMPQFNLARRMYERSLPVWDEAGATGYTGDGPRALQVTGMPRSGTTLVEQIISSHSTVSAAGEVGVVGNLSREALEIPDLQGEPLDAGGLRDLGEKITHAYGELFPKAAAVTDKAILSNIFAGIFARALPNGRMVVLRRDPRDNCLSMYKNRFQPGTHEYTTDLEALAFRYLGFLDVLKYWREQAPGSFYEIRYEELIENPEEETRRLIDYCGLEWEDACLEFYKNKRQVKTLSAFQVRQKLYSSSVGAWKNYEEELEPLIRILDKGGALEGY